jgi:TetR/AcrR family transcriptional regulator, transcriptional repressor for nem operon
MESDVNLTPTKRDEILDAAESMMRVAGYNAFSTRDVAEAVAIKAASVHYYFPTKSDIGAAVAERYTHRFIESLGEPAEFKGNAHKALAHYVDAFRTALVRDGKLCLCAVLGAESGGLPPEVRAGARIFFERNLEWLTVALNNNGKRGLPSALNRATLVLAALEGAMILSKTLTDEAVFERVAKGLIPVADA